MSVRMPEGLRNYIASSAAEREMAFNARVVAMLTVVMDQELGCVESAVSVVGPAVDPVVLQPEWKGADPK